MRSSTVRLRLILALLAWLAQLCLPVAHASMMAAAPSSMPGWCGDPSRGAAMMAELPPELRKAFADDEVSVDDLASCAQFCATGMAPTVSLPTTVLLRAAGLEPAPAIPPQPRTRAQSPTPPSQGPPASL